MERSRSNHELKLRERLRQHLENAGLSASELSRRANVPRQTISDWLAGAPPRSLAYLKCVADVFQCSLEDLLFDSSLAHARGGPNTQASETCRIAKMLEANSDMLGYWDAQLRNVYANDAYLDYFGKSPEEIRGKSLAEVLGPDLFARNFPYIKAALEGKCQVFEREFIIPSGGVRTAIIKYIPDFQDGEVRGFAVIGTDISQFK